MMIIAWTQRKLVAGMAAIGLVAVMVFTTGIDAQHDAGSAQTMFDNWNAQRDIHIDDLEVRIKAIPKSCDVNVVPQGDDLYFLYTRCT